MTTARIFAAVVIAMQVGACSSSAQQLPTPTASPEVVTDIDRYCDGKPGELSCRRNFNGDIAQSEAACVPSMADVPAGPARRERLYACMTEKMREMGYNITLSP